MKKNLLETAVNCATMFVQLDDEKKEIAASAMIAMLKESGETSFLNYNIAQTT